MRLTASDFVSYPKIESMAADLHLLAAPLRFILAAVKVLLFTLSFPLLCGLVMLSYAVPGIDPLHRYIEFVQAHNVSPVVYPFVILGALLLLAVNMLLVVARDLGGIADILLRAPLLGTMLFALASTFWLVIVRGVYRRRDGQENLKGWSSLLLGFTIAMVAGLYVSACQDSLPPAALLCFATLAAFSPTLLYLLYRVLKQTR
jgi:hypothetical protein